MTHAYIAIGFTALVVAGALTVRQFLSDHKLSRSKVKVLTSRLSDEQLEAMFVDSGGRSVVSVFDEVRHVQLIQAKHLDWALRLDCLHPASTGNVPLVEATVSSELVYPTPVVSQSGLFFSLFRYVLPDKVIRHADEIGWTKRRFIKSVRRADPESVITLFPEYLNIH